MRTRNALLTAALVAPLLLAACGGGNGSAADKGSSSPTELSVTAPGGLKFDAKTYTAASGGDGVVTVTFENKDAQSHSVVFETASEEKVPGTTRVLLAGGTSKTFDVALTPGQYKLICDVPGHKSAGMIADLTVS